MSGLPCLESTKLRATALKLRKAVDTFRVHSADGQPLQSMPAMFGAPRVDGIETAAALDAACTVWLNARGYKVVES